MNETGSNFLQILNVMLTSGVLALLVGAAVAYGRLTQEVKNQGESIVRLWKAQDQIREHVFGEGRQRP